ncbi:alcohol dehydrogenase catalytic domain-containing protein [Pseudoroseomonas wenyumeiae]
MPAVAARSRVVLIDRPGGPEVLRLEEREVGAPREGEVLLRHTAIGVNFIDIQHRSGRYPLPSYPATLGIEAAGVVLDVGAGVQGVQPGQRVAYSFPPWVPMPTFVWCGPSIWCPFRIACLTIWRPPASTRG